MPRHHRMTFEAVDAVATAIATSMQTQIAQLSRHNYLAEIDRGSERDTMTVQETRKPLHVLDKLHTSISARPDAEPPSIRERVRRFELHLQIDRDWPAGRPALRSHYGLARPVATSSSLTQWWRRRWRRRWRWQWQAVTAPRCDAFRRLTQNFVSSSATTRGATRPPRGIIGARGRAPSPAPSFRRKVVERTFCFRRLNAPCVHARSARLDNSNKILFRIIWDHDRSTIDE